MVIHAQIGKLTILLLGLLLVPVSILRADRTVDPNVIFSGYLDNEDLHFEVVKSGSTIPLNSVIVMPASVGGGGGFLSIAFDRSDVHEQFINDFFYERNSDIRQSHTFGYKQLEALLYPDRLVLNIHDGIVIHLRSDIGSPRNYRTFRTDSAVAEVLAVRGRVYYSKDQEIIKRRLAEFYVAWELGIVPGGQDTATISGTEDGIQMTKKIGEDAIPVYYEPKVVFDRGSMENEQE